MKVVGLSSYKLVQFLKNYLNVQRVETPIVICSLIAWNWLCKFRYEYKNVRKDEFIDGHEWSDIDEDHRIFWEKMKEIKPYLVEFDVNSAIKPKIYPLNCIIRGNS